MSLIGTPSGKGPHSRLPIHLVTSCESKSLAGSQMVSYSTNAIVCKKQNMILEKWQFTGFCYMQKTELPLNYMSGWIAHLGNCMLELKGRKYVPGDVLESKGKQCPGIEKQQEI